MPAHAAACRGEDRSGIVFAAVDSVGICGERPDAVLPSAAIPNSARNRHCAHRAPATDGNRRFAAGDEHAGYFERLPPISALPRNAGMDNANIRASPRLHTRIMQGNRAARTWLRLPDSALSDRRW